MDGRLYARIVWFHAYNTPQDVDNIAKRILDALIGTVYPSDVLVVRCTTEKVYYTSEKYELIDAGAPADVGNRLTELIGSQARDILYIEVGELSSRQVVVGPSDRSVA
jgi:hypothetical protein